MANTKTPGAWLNFSELDVLLMLSGAKTHHRVPINLSPVRHAADWIGLGDGESSWLVRDVLPVGSGIDATINHETLIHCPFGKIGDTVRVREPFWCLHDTDTDGYREIDCGPCLDIGPEIHPGIQYVASPASESPPVAGARSATWGPGSWWEGPPEDWDEETEYQGAGKWEFLPWPDHLTTQFAPSKMPDWACRLSLKVASIRAVRLQDITEDEAATEGVYPHTHRTMGVIPARFKFGVAWDRRHRSRSRRWHANPWVWDLGFSIAESRS